MYSPQSAAGAWNDPPVVRDASKVFIHLVLILFFLLFTVCDPTCGWCCASSMDRSAGNIIECFRARTG